MHFNESQLCAIRHVKGPCMVLAGPGSGKTSVITNRVRTLTEEFSVRPENILVITFTRAAAQEMKTRYLKFIGREGTGVTFGTFHSVFYQMLRHGYAMDASKVLTETERYRILAEILGKVTDHGDTDGEYLTALLSGISRLKNSRIPPEQAFPDTRVDFRAVYQRYEEEKRRRGRIDYDDMLTLCLKMLRENEAERSLWQQKFQYILIDEFQDINPVQLEAVRILTLPENNLFIVGDDDQSVYRFRGASPELMLNFPKQYPDVKKIYLTVNYRSEEEIVRAADRLIRHNRKRFEKELRADGSAKTAGGKRQNRTEQACILTERFPDEEAECERTAELILQEETGGTLPGQIAVLVRTNAGASCISKKLTEKGIPFTIHERVPNLFRHAVCTPVYGCLNYVLGNRTRHNFLKFMNCPPRYIRRSDLLSETISLEELIGAYEKDPERDYMADRIRHFEAQLALLKRLRTPYAMINYYRKGMEYDAMVKETAPEKKTDPAELLHTLDLLQESAKPYETVEEWYAYIAKYTREIDREAQERRKESDRVLISTLHGAKGLEFETVFLLDVNEGNIPHEKASGEADLEEERRMFYVGMTRAAKKLRLFSVSERYGKKAEISRFLKEAGQS